MTQGVHRRATSRHPSLRTQRHSRAANVIPAKAGIQNRTESPVCGQPFLPFATRRGRGSEAIAGDAPGRWEPLRRLPKVTATFCHILITGFRLSSSINNHGVKRHAPLAPDHAETADTQDRNDSGLFPHHHRGIVSGGGMHPTCPTHSDSQHRSHRPSRSRKSITHCNQHSRTRLPSHCPRRYRRNHGSTRINPKSGSDPSANLYTNTITN